MTVTRVLSLMLFGGYLLSVGASSAVGQDDFIARRQKLMKGNSAAAKEIKTAMAKKDYATVASQAKIIVDSRDMAVFAKLWPGNSTDPKSRARPEIWQKWNDFMEKDWTLQQEALALVAAAKAKDDSKMTQAYKALGDTCSSCHKSFRAPKK